MVTFCENADINHPAVPIIMPIYSGAPQPVRVESESSDDSDIELVGIEKSPSKSKVTRTSKILTPPTLAVQIHQSSIPRHDNCASCASTIIDITEEDPAETWAADQHGIAEARKLALLACRTTEDEKELVRRGMEGARKLALKACELATSQYGIAEATKLALKASGEQEPSSSQQDFLKSLCLIRQRDFQVLSSSIHQGFV